MIWLQYGVWGKEWKNIKLERVLRSYAKDLRLDLMKMKSHCRLWCGGIYLTLVFRGMRHSALLLVALFIICHVSGTGGDSGPRPDSMPCLQGKT